MKKSIATIALFSLALVTTSFTTSETSNNLANTLSVDPPPTGGTAGTGGQSTGDGRKLDIYSTNDQSANKHYQLDGFNNDTQSAIASRKMD